MMKLGFTGTRRGMTPAQREAFRKMVLDLQPTEFHHGDCVGADAEAHDCVAELVPSCKRVVHPPVAHENRAHRTGDETREPKTQLARNRDIVGDTDLLVGASVSDAPLATGGTWYTIGYAKKRGKPAKVLWPDGRVTDG